MSAVTYIIENYNWRCIVFTLVYNVKWGSVKEYDIHAMIGSHDSRGQRNTQKSLFTRNENLNSQRTSQPHGTSSFTNSNSRSSHGTSGFTNSNSRSSHGTSGFTNSNSRSPHDTSSAIRQRGNGNPKGGRVTIRFNNEPDRLGRGNNNVNNNNNNNINNNINMNDNFRQIQSIPNPQFNSLPSSRQSPQLQTMQNPQFNAIPPGRQSPITYSVRELMHQQLLTRQILIGLIKKQLFDTNGRYVQDPAARGANFVDPRKILRPQQSFPNFGGNKQQLPGTLTIQSTGAISVREVQSPNGETKIIIDATSKNNKTTKTPPPLEEIEAP
ncbi:Hypothetical predicted protein [Mytilus galloprovincialis]|uniref:Uncharacterized protein n=1 Tax=Mytilus galloprovincialis TaxID=29158 RepID=A0A8B6DEE6_MYTGA|nr:Hypothetical predicted protein [Mytilus galloprovincialis]